MERVPRTVFTGLAASSSCNFIRFVINFNSFRIHCNSRVVADMGAVGVAGIQLCPIVAFGGNELGTYALLPVAINGDAGGSCGGGVHAHSFGVQHVLG